MKINFLKQETKLIQSGRMLTFIFLFTLAGYSALATTYYVDNVKGSDGNSGTSVNKAWKSLAKVNNTIFSAGDRILLKAGGRWTGQLKFQGSGKAGNPIVVDQYGAGNKPQIHAEGMFLVAVLLENGEYWEVNNLEITNSGKEVQSGGTGVLLSLNNFGSAHGIKLKNLYVHDINGDNKVRQRGGFGIHWSAEGNSYFDGLLIEGCHLVRTDCNGIWGDGSKDSYHQNVIIRNNLLEDIGGDGIVVCYANNTLIEYNRLHKARQRVLTSCAGIWPWSSDGTVIQFNEVSGVKGFEDGMSFDVDSYCHNTIFQYNYSHDNDGGFLLVMPMTGATVRYNISQNDGNGSRIIHFTRPVDSLLVYNNTFYGGSGIITKLIQYGPKSFDNPKVRFENNIFYVNGSATIERLTFLPNGEQYMYPDGTYPSEMVIEESLERSFRNNIFFPPTNFGNRPLNPSNKTVNPVLVAPGNSKDIKSLSGYQLKKDSPAIGAGLFINNNGGRDFFGNILPVTGSPDAGAHQLSK